ncbi:MAG: nicotinate (nicotinamide) nucleotide adenylyltransferase [Chloroflexi bacterium]|nr:nicotinate (nicotinamide) nucleotide adenylyltransferase [Chloroflexota bacterium]
MSSQAGATDRIGVFGGTFDPPHYGHLILAEEVRHALRLARVLFLPAGQPPHKPDAAISPVADRVAMTRLAIAGNPAFGLDLHDVERAGPSYTADTMEALARRWPAAALWFIMGEDSLADLPTWHEPARIVRAARLAVMTRPGVTVDLAALDRLILGLRGRVDLVPTLAIGIAARDLRQRVAEGRPVRYQTPPAVEDYIRERGLYSAAGASG